MTSLVVIDNFLPYPNIVRSWALQQKFYSAEEMSEKYQKPNSWPGLRSQNINELDLDFANVVLGKISSLAKLYFGLNGQFEIRSSFQITSFKDGTSWIHRDDDVDAAGLIYLTPNPPINSGTDFYQSFDGTIVDSIGNLYNRLIMYPSTRLHKSAEYFGDNTDNSRLTLVFFITGR